MCPEHNYPHWLIRIKKSMGFNSKLISCLACYAGYTFLLILTYLNSHTTYYTRWWCHGISYFSLYWTGGGNKTFFSSQEERKKRKWMPWRKKNAGSFLLFGHTVLWRWCHCPLQPKCQRSVIQVFSDVVISLRPHESLCLRLHIDKREKTKCPWTWSDRNSDRVCACLFHLRACVCACTLCPLWVLLLLRVRAHR